MIYLATILSVIFFLLGFWVFKVVPEATCAVKTTKIAIAKVIKPDISDTDKEEIMQVASLSLMKNFFLILLRGSGALLISSVPAIVFDFFGLVAFEDTMNFLFSWEVIAVTSILMVFAYYTYRSKKNG